MKKKKIYYLLSCSFVTDETVVTIVKKACTYARECQDGVEKAREFQNCCNERAKVKS